MQAQIKRIKIFDFDGTLVRTPSKPKNWQGGWWGKSVSLLPPWMPSSKQLAEKGMHLLDQKVYAEYQKAIADPESLTVLMTGRHQGLRWIVLQILDGFGIDPEATVKQRAIFISGGKTLEGKMAQIGKMVGEFPNVDEVEMWEDRPEHVLAFREFGKKLKKNVTLWVHEPPDWD